MLAAAIESVLRGTHQGFELLVIDQTRDAPPVPFASDARVRHVPMAPSGVSAARNLGARLASGDVIAMLDDDCVASETWLSDIERSFDKHARLGLLFGNVRPAWKSDSGAIPAYERHAGACARNIWQKFRIEGIGACMAFRKRAWEAAHGFDEMLGSGSRFHGAEDTDLTFKILLRGFEARDEPGVWVTHRGYRDAGQIVALGRNYYVSTGAVFAKYLKLTPGPMLLNLLWLALRFPFRRSIISASLGPGFSGGEQLVAFCHGFKEGLQASVDGDSLNFRP
jgi:glycosyltransferase involved in cell wall biosynthesis